MLIQHLSYLDTGSEWVFLCEVQGNQETKKPVSLPGKPRAPCHVTKSKTCNS